MMPNTDLLLLAFKPHFKTYMFSSYWHAHKTCTGTWFFAKLGKQEAQLSPSDRAMRLVSSNLANCHATVQKILIRQVLIKLMV